MTETPTTLTLYPSKRKTFLFLLTSIILMFGGILMIGGGETIGWFVAIFFGIGCLFFITTLLPNSSYLRITNKELEIRTLFKSNHAKWDEVDHFGTEYIGPKKMVVFNYASSHTKFKTGKKITKTLTGIDGALPDTYGKSAENLAKLLNDRKEKFSKK